MPREVRYILFEQAELARAISDWSRMNGRQLPASSIWSVAVTERADGVDVIYRVGHEHRATRDQVIIDHSIDEYDLTAALLRYCRQTGIPLPRRAAKRLEVIDGALALLITGYQADRTPDVRNERVLYDDPKLKAVQGRLRTDSGKPGSAIGGPGPVGQHRAGSARY